MQKDSDRPRRIVHVDMDAFFAAVEELDRPELHGRPVIIGADPQGGKGRGVVSTCNYEARRFGIHSAMPISRAWRLCPEGVYLPPRVRRYRQLSASIMQSLSVFTPVVEIVGLDEAYLDCTGTELLFPDDGILARSIQERIRSMTGLSASVGIAPNKYIAKIASDLNKPSGISICPAGREADFLGVLPLKRLWGAGKKTIQVLEREGCRKIGDLARMPDKRLSGLLGKRGLQLKRLACGRDDRPVNSEHERKSMSEELTFPRDTADLAYLETCLAIIADRLGQKLRREHFSFKCIQLKLRYANFETCTRSRTLPEHSRLSGVIRDHALELFRSMDTRGRKCRLIGIGLSQLLHESRRNVQLPLFRLEDLDPALRIQQRRDAVMDQIQSRFGNKLTSARSIFSG